MLKEIITWSRKKSPWVCHLSSGGSCNGCEIEILACLAPRIDLERFGILLKGSPRHSDVLLVTGILTKRACKEFLTVYNQTPDPKAVIAIGACACSGGCFQGSYNRAPGGLKQNIPIAAFVPGCPPKPEAIVQGVVTALKKMK